MGKRLQMAPTGEYILWAVIPETDKSTFNRAYGPFASRSAAYSAKTALINNKRTAMKHEGYNPEEIEAEVAAIEWATTVLWNKVPDGQELVLEPAEAIDLDSPAEAAAEALWNNQGPVIRGVRPKWDVARNEAEWAKSVQRFRADGRLAVEAAGKVGGNEPATKNDTTTAEPAS